MQNETNNFFTIKTSCKDCPFRKDIYPYLTAKRVKEIQSALEEKDVSFSCHKTVDYINKTPRKKGFHKPTNKEKQCAGALILLIKSNTLLNNFLFKFALNHSI